jgi:crotonobetainyl-CoA:carnitine CoA-transferase CaiB-like acyl-CoA transferase
MTVIDLSRGAPGPISTMVLADYGARVIRVESPHEDAFARFKGHRAWGRGKESVCLDLASPGDRAVLDRLLATADVLVESFEPGRLGAWGLGYAEVHERHSQLVYCSITGYGQTGSWRDRPGYDALVAARLGLMDDQTGYRAGPIFLGFPMATYGTVFVAVLGILSAIRARRFTGRGQQVDASLLDGVLVLSTMSWLWSEQAPPRNAVMPRADIPDWFKTTRRFVVALLQCSDGEYLQLHTGARGAFGRLLALLGIADRVTPAATGIELAEPLTEEESDLVWSELLRQVASAPRAEWLARLWKADVAALPVLRPGELFEDDQVAHNGTIIEVDDPVLGRTRQVGPVMAFSRTPASVSRPAPLHGQHTEKILAELRGGEGAPRRGGAEARWRSWRAGEVGDLGDLGADPALAPSPRHALEGLKVLDFGVYFAGPYASKMLSDLGADVLKVEPTDGDQGRPLLNVFEAAQRGKRCLAVNLKSPEGRKIAEALVAQADVVHHNFRPGAAERLGLDYKTLRKINPRLIYCYSPGFGSSGPKAQLQSFEPLQSGFAGLFYQAAGEGNPPQGQLGNADYFNSLLGACGILMALYHRDRTGEGQYIESTQLTSALFVNSELIKDADGAIISRFQLDHDQAGLSPLYRLYRTQNGWICVACPGDRNFQKLAQALGCPELAPDPRFASAEARANNADSLTAILSARFSERTTDAWIAALDAANAPFEVPRDRYGNAFLRDPEHIESGRAVKLHHATWGEMLQVGQVVHLSETPGIIRAASPLLGEHSEQVLRDLGYEDDQIRKLRSDGVIASAAT